MRNTSILITFLLFLLSCNQQNDTKAIHQLSDSTEDTSKTEIIKQDTLPRGSLYPGSDTLVVDLKMDSLNNHLSVSVYISSGRELFASLSSEDRKANIRISQIGFPDSTFDGPFGRNLKYQIKTTGNYKIIIGENMMAGDPWKGDFSLKIWVK